MSLVASREELDIFLFPVGTAGTERHVQEAYNWTQRDLRRFGSPPPQDQLIIRPVPSETKYPRMEPHHTV